jgi:hypothetical protein
MELFHKLIQKNRKKDLEHIQDINVNGKIYSGSDEVILGFQEHFRSLSTFDKSTHQETSYLYSDSSTEFLFGMFFL